MKKMLYIRNSIITLLCVTIIFMAVGFIVLSVRLKNETNKVSSFNVIFSSIQKASSIKGSTVEPIGKAEIIENGKELDMSFTLSSPHDELTYVATIQNNGTLSAEIVDVLESPNYRISSFQNLLNPISITLSDIKGKIIPAGESIELKIVVYYPFSSEAGVSKTIPYKIGLITESR